MLVAGADTDHLFELEALFVIKIVFFGAADMHFGIVSCGTVANCGLFVLSVYAFVYEKVLLVFGKCFFVDDLIKSCFLACKPCLPHAESYRGYIENLECKRCLPQAE